MKINNNLKYKALRIKKDKLEKLVNIGFEDKDNFYIYKEGSNECITVNSIDRILCMYSPYDILLPYVLYELFEEDFIEKIN